MKWNRLKYVAMAFLLTACSLGFLTGCGDKSANTSKDEKTTEVKKVAVKNTFSHYNLTKNFRLTDDKNKAVWDAKILWIKPKSNTVDVRYAITNASKKERDLNVRDIILNTSPRSVQFVVDGPHIGWLDDNYKMVTVKPEETTELTVRYGESEENVQKRDTPTSEKYITFEGKNGEKEKVSYNGEVVNFQSDSGDSSSQSRD